MFRFLQKNYPHFCGQNYLSYLFFINLSYFCLIFLSRLLTVLWDRYESASAISSSVIPFSRIRNIWRSVSFNSSRKAFFNSSYASSLFSNDSDILFLSGTSKDSSSASASSDSIAPILVFAWVHFFSKLSLEAADREKVLENGYVIKFYVADNDHQMGCMPENAEVCRLYREIIYKSVTIHSKFSLE